MIQNFLLLCLFLAIYWLLFRKFIISLLDPIWIMLVMLASGSVLSLQQYVNKSDVVFFFLAVLFLWAGFFTLKKPKIQRGDYLETPKFQIKYLEYVTYGLFFVYVLANIYAMSQIGIAIFSNNPTEFKSGAFSGGLGIVRRINWGTNMVIACGAVFFIAIRYRTWRFLFILFCLIVIAFMSGSKSGVLWYLLVLSFGFTKFQAGLRIPARYRRLSFTLLVLALTSAMYVLYIQRGSVATAFNGLVERVLLSSDIVLYYYQPKIQDAYGHYNALDFFRYEFNGIFGLLRLDSYKEPYGYEMVQLYLSNTGQRPLTTIMGPNLLFFVKARMFFGWIPGLLYCYFIGVFIAWIRKRFFEATNLSPIYFVLLFAISMYAIGMTIESGLFITQVFDMSYLFAFLFLIVAVLMGKIPALRFYAKDQNLQAA